MEIRPRRGHEREQSMPKYSVRKPFTVLVSVILVIVLGFVSLSGMQTDLLPEMNLPYLLVVTTYPGASPEQVEADVTKPLEDSLSTLNGVKNVTSQSSENYSVVILEYQEDTNMDSALVKASTAVNQIEGSLPELAATPMLIEMSPDMMASQYVAVDCQDMDVYELSALVENTVLPRLERLDGVASVSTIGLVERTVEVRLDEGKIDALNDRLLSLVSDRLAKARGQLDVGEAQIRDGLRALDQAEQQLKDGTQQLADQKAGLTSQLRSAIDRLNREIPQLEREITDLRSQLERAQRQLEALHLSETVEISLPLDDELLRSAREILSRYDPQYRASAMPQTLKEAERDAAKTAAMLASIGRAEEAIDQAAGELTGGRSVSAALAETEGQILSLTLAIQGKDQELVTLNQQLETAAPEEQEAIRARIQTLETERAELLTQRNALDTQRKRLSAWQEELATLSAAKAALNNAALLVKAREDAEGSLNDGTAELRASLEASIAQLNEQIDRAERMLASLRAQLAELQSVLRQLEEDPLDQGLADMAVQLLLSGSEAQLGLGQLRIEIGRTQLQAGETQLAAARQEYEAAREEALKSANLDQLLNLTTLSQLLMAQNFSMPAGYIESGSDRYLLKVGDAFGSIDELRDMLLCSVDGIGDVRMGDIATVELTDNADDSYAKVGGNRAVLLAVYKSSTASTSAVTRASSAAMEELEGEIDGLHLTAIMDQGDYIQLIVDSVMSNLIWGAILAILVLAVFLKDIRPTAVVAISMPLSVLFAIVLMYFSGITLNILSLSGLALGIGMLVDNSVVVIENIYRLRNRGVPAPRAAVQGAKQVAGPILSSTLTTVCVFLPMLFASGMVRTLLADMAWTITFSLMASLVVALTVVPCSGATLLRRQKEIRQPLFDLFLARYEILLRRCLRHKAWALIVAVALLGLSVWRIVTMGVVLFPEMNSNQLSVNVTVSDDTPKADAFAAADAVMEAITAVDGVESVGAMSGGAGSMMTMVGGTAAETDNTSFTFYVLLTDKGAQRVPEIQTEIQDATAALPCEVQVMGSGMMDIDTLYGSGVKVVLYGSDLEALRQAGQQVSELMAGIPGIENISDGQEGGDPSQRIVVDKDAAMRLGLTVAQVYQQIAASLTTEATATTLQVSGSSYPVILVDGSGVPELENLLDMAFETSTMDETGGTVKETHLLREFASLQESESYLTIARENGSRYLTVSSETADGYNTTLLSRELEPKLAALDLPAGCTAELSGESSSVQDMVVQMSKMMALALLLVYFVMVAQFQSLLSPFIVLFTIPLAFTGGMLGLMLLGEQLSLVSLMGFLILMGVVVNNGIVFVDYANQLRIGGLGRTDALVATGKTRMRPILMTTLTTVLAMTTMLFGTDMASSMGRGMAIVIIGGLSYATLMTLFIVPVMYDLFYRRPPVNIDVGDDSLDDLPDDAAEFAAEFAARGTASQPEDDAPRRGPFRRKGQGKEARK